MKQILFLILAAFISIGSIVAQQTVSGTVIGIDGEPVIGATVLVKGTTTGTATDFDGRFSLNVSEGDVLSISFVGYLTEEVEYTGQSNIEVILTEDAILIDEAVVTGYTQQQRERITGAISTVRSENLEAIPIASFDQILQGRAAGLMVIGNSGQPGSTASQVMIRGFASGAPAPLYIVDGVQVGSAVFNSLNANDIESVSVLKDASSAAIYGAAGANGVIIVTTKTHERGQPTMFNYRGSYGVNTFTTGQFEMMNSTEKLAFEEKARRGPGWELSPMNPINEGASEDVLERNEMLLDSLRGINTNWRDEVFQTGTTMTHELNMSGGTERSDYFISGQYFTQEGQVKESTFERGTLRFNFNHRASDRVRFGIRSLATFSESNFITTEGAVNLNNPIAFAYLANPYEQVYLDDGSYQFGAVGRNFIEDIDFNENTTRRNAANLSGYFEIDLLPGLTARTQWGTRYQINEGNRYIDPESALGMSVQGNQGSLGRSFGRTFNLTGFNTLQYRRLIQDVHEFRLTAGQEYRYTNGQSFSFTGYGLSSGIRTPAGITPGTGDNGFIPGVGGGKSERAISSFFGELNYTFDSRYNLSSTIRRDASSVFGEDTRSGIFYSVGASWNIDREQFFNVNWVDNLKLAISYGSLGSEASLGNYERRVLLSPNAYDGQAALIPSTPGNPDLQWEALQGLNFNIDFSLLRNRVMGEINLYNNETTNYLITQSLPRTTGWASQTINAGSLRNRGVEVELEVAVINTPDLRWSVGGNYAYNDNEVTDLGQVSEFEVGTSIVREGVAIGSHYVVRYAGVNPANGEALYLDIDGNVTNNFSASNRVPLGSYIPPHNGSVFTDLHFQNFHLSALGVFAAGHELFNNQTFFITNPNFAQYNQSKEMNNMWEQPGDITNIPRVDDPRQFSSRDIEKADFFRLRNVTLAYQIPGSVLNSNTFRNIRVYVTGQNLLTITNFTGFDPEINNNIAQFEYPPQRSFTFGVDVGF